MSILYEIWSTVRKNKLRTVLTGFSVAWGIFMLILLLGAGNGLRHGIVHNFDDFSVNRVEIWPRYTTKPYKGMQSNRRVAFKDEDIRLLPLNNPEIELITGSISKSDTVSYGEEYNLYSLRGVHAELGRIEKIKIPSGQGRFINEADVLQSRKVIVISSRMKEVLFRTEEPVGKYVRVGELLFQVVGVHQSSEDNNNAPAYIPFSTAQMIYKQGGGTDELIFTVNGLYTEEQDKAFEQRIRTQLARRHHFAPDDVRAIGYWSMLENFRMWNGMLNGISLFIWIIGISTLTAGVVGVSNIMLISVRERTKEFGIRKAIGATPWSILKLVIVEAVIITTVFGYFGMLGGIGVTEAINSVMENMNTVQSASRDDISIFRDPTVDMGIALSSTLLLVVAGVLAGYFPARKAVKITAIEAMRHE